MLGLIGAIGSLGSGIAQMAGISSAGDALREGVSYAKGQQVLGAQEIARNLINATERSRATQVGGVNRGAAALSGGVRQGRRQQVNALRRVERMYQPLAQQGRRAQSALSYELGLTDQPSWWSGLELTPAGQFRMQQGRDAIEAGASATGGLRSGATLKALEDYRQDVATADRELQLDRLTGEAQRGRSAIDTVASTRMGIGDARAGAANALAQIEADRIGGVTGLNANRDLALGQFRADRNEMIRNARANWGVQMGNIGATEAMGMANATSGMIGNLAGVGSAMAQMYQPPTSGGGGSPNVMVPQSTLAGAANAIAGGGGGSTMSGNALRFPGIMAAPNPSMGMNALRMPMFGRMQRPFNSGGLSFGF